jgi:putative transposase
LHTRTGRVLTAKGVKPVCSYQHKFENTYLYGAFSPINGESLLLELPYCNTECFQLFLNELSNQKPTELKVVVLDNGAFHKSKKLIIPENILLIFLPPYSPELNPAEKIWWYIKQEFVCKSFKDIDCLSKYLCTVVRETLDRKTIKSICSFDYLQCNF